MNHQVGIAPDRRGEMGVTTRSEAKVTFILRRVASLFQGSKHQVGQNPFLGLPSKLLHQLLIVFWRDSDIYCLQHRVAMRREAWLSFPTPGAILQARQVRYSTLGKATTQPVAEAERDFVE